MRGASISVSLLSQLRALVSIQRLFDGFRCELLFRDAVGRVFAYLSWQPAMAEWKKADGLGEVAGAKIHRRLSRDFLPIGEIRSCLSLKVIE